MSPTPLIELQRRLSEAGRIRMGKKGAKGQPERLTTWRVTSPDQTLVEQAAALYGGLVQPWEAPTGPQWEVITTRQEIPVIVMPSYSLRQQYEFRVSPTEVQRRCDGSEMETGEPCKCAIEGLDSCDLITRLTIALPELTTLLGWRLETKGEQAARELLGSLELVHAVAAGRPFVPAKLRIVERRGHKDGHATRYVVPVVDVAVSYTELATGKPQLQATYTPIQNHQAVTVDQGLAQTGIPRYSKFPVPEPDEDDIPFGDHPIQPDNDPPLPPPATSDTGERAALERTLADISTRSGHPRRGQAAVRKAATMTDQDAITYLQDQIEKAAAQLELATNGD